MPTDRDVQHLIINKLTKAQYEAIETPDPNQLYFIIDDNDYAKLTDLPQPSNAAPAMDGTAAAGIAVTYSRSDHVHPTDTSKQDKITANGILKGNGTGGVTAAVAGTDYAAASHTHGDITNDGDITATATIASGDRLVINDESASKVTNSSITFGDAQNLFLANDGTWQRPQGIFSVIANYDTYTNKWVGNIDTPELYEGLTMVLFLPFDPNDNIDETTDGEIQIKLTLNDNSDTGFISVVSDSLYTVITNYFTKGNSIVLTYWDAHNYDSTIATGTYKWFTNEPLPESDGNIGNMLIDLGLMADTSAFSTRINSNNQNIIDETGNIIVNSYITQGGGFY